MKHGFIAVGVAAVFGCLTLDIGASPPAAAPAAAAAAPTGPVSCGCGCSCGCSCGCAWMQAHNKAAAQQAAAAKGQQSQSSKQTVHASTPQPQLTKRLNGTMRTYTASLMSSYAAMSSMACPVMPYPGIANPYMVPSYYPTPVDVSAPPVNASLSGTNSSDAALGTARQDPPRIVPPPPPETMNRLRYVSLNVSGVRNAGDRDKLEYFLSKMKEVRGVTVRRQEDGAATVKVWYSEREPVKSEILVEEAAKIGFEAVVAEAN